MGSWVKARVWIGIEVRASRVRVSRVKVRVRVTAIRYTKVVW